MATRTETERGSPPPKVNKSIRLDPDVVDWLDADAKEHGRTVAQSLRFYLLRGKEAAA